MSVETNDGGSAFPIGSGDMRDPIGMTLRDWLSSVLAEIKKEAKE